VGFLPPMTETTRLLKDLVVIPSVNPMGRDLQGPQIYEHRVTAYLEEFFRSLGVRCERQRVAPLRDNIVAYFEPPAPAKTTVLFVAHQDTVPTDNMTIDPFAARIEGGRLYGRGACDIKGGMAAMLAAFARLTRQQPPGAANLILACTVDEEHTFLGVQRLIQSGLRATYAVVAEPTGLNIVRAHKGAVRWHVNTPGQACHSSSPEKGVNAIYRMGRLLQVIERYAQELRSGRADPYLGPASLSVGRIEGGTSVNTVPDRCRIEVDRRLIPGEDPRAALGQFAEFVKVEGKIDFPFECSDPWTALLPLDWQGPEGKSELVVRLGGAIDQERGRHEVMAVPYGTEAAPLAAAGIPAVVFGPGDIAQAHTCDEWVSLEQVEQASDILYRFACMR
jgi:acetylornithine deacetylase ArgE